MTNKFTEGPWHVENMLGDIIVYAEDKGNKGQPICKVTRQGPMDEVYGNDNACLIAAAPELFNALENLVTWSNILLSGYYPNEGDKEYAIEKMEESHEKANLAIKKARGES